MNTVEEIQHWLSETDAGHVLELAAGSGKFTAWITGSLKHFDSWVFTDPDYSMLMKAKEQLPDPRFSFVCTSAEQLPFSDETFDTVVISRGLHHLSNLSAAVAEMIRVLKPEGNLFIHEMHANIFNEAQQNRHLWHQLRIELDQKLGINHSPVFSRNELLQTFQNSSLNRIALFEYIPADGFNPAEKRKEYEQDITLLDNPTLQKHFSQKLQELIIRTEKLGLENQPYLFMVFRKTL